MTTLPCILIPILVGIISALLGYLLGRLNSKNQNDNDNTNNYQTEYDNCIKNSNSLKDKISQLELELANCKHTISTPSNDVNLRTGFATTENNVNIETELPFDPALALSVFGKKIKNDDLKIVEGIGPKIEELFQNEGIKTWKMLAETSIEKLKAILEKGGERFKLHNPSTWAKQAKYAYEGKWDELKRWQDELDGGRE
jgi:predicted flap endonuclease-1-like 5' DNA nuclease